VRRSLSLTAQQALAQGVVDLMAEDLDDLLSQLEGRHVAMGTHEVVLAVAGAPRERIPMTLMEGFLHFLVNPDIAYLLMAIGMLAIMIELFHPGVGVPGMVGAICLILAFIAFENLPLNWGGVALIVLALVLFALDIKVAGFALSVGGAVAFVLGSLILFNPLAPRSPALPVVHVSPWLIALMTATTAGLFTFALAAGIRAQRLPVQVGAHTVVGVHGTAVTKLAPAGIVQAAGEQWTGVAEAGTIAAGEPVEVVALDGNKVVVRRRASDRSG
jgi:membrane-bound serine protease (ClpP class)